MSTSTKPTTRHQKLFRNGGSQAVRIPKEMKFETEEVLLHKEGDRLIIEPKVKTLKNLSKQFGQPIDWNWTDSDTPTQSEDLF